MPRRTTPSSLPPRPSLSKCSSTATSRLQLPGSLAREAPARRVFTNRFTRTKPSFLLAETAQSERSEGMEPDDLLCSRNARPKKALVGRAQWKINQPPSLKRERASLEGTLYNGRRLFLRTLGDRLDHFQKVQCPCSLAPRWVAVLLSACGIKLLRVDW